ncbi:MAG: CDP-alcohol phosphatidyltransferase family protein [Pseudohongiellaceae bacterium]
MPVKPSDPQQELQWITVSGSVLLLAMAMVFSTLEGPLFALRWLPAGLVCWVLVVWQCHTRLHRNRGTEDGRLYHSLGHGTRVTLLRGLLIAATAGFLTTAGMETRPVLLFLPALFYTVAALGDALDGHLARRQQHTTQLGAELDTALDALGLLVAPLLAVLYGKLHASYLLVSVAYYLFQWGIHWRRRHGRPVHGLPPSRLRRHLAGLQMVVVAAALWPPLPAGTTRVLGVFFMLPLLLGFWRDWLHVSGRRGTGQEPST